jgi:hypothetical protein
MNNNEIRLRNIGDTAHGLVFDGGVDGPNLHGNLGGRLSQGSGGGTARLTWDSTGTYTRGTGGSTTFLAQYQTDLTGSLDSSIAVTAGETDEAALFFGTVNVNDPTKAHKAAIIADGQGSWGRSNLHFCINDEGNDSASAAIANSRMMIERNGDVGIGNVDPAAKLDVTGTIKATDLLVDGTTTTSSLIVENPSFNTTITTNSISNWSLTLPADSGLGGQVLSTDGSGVTSWVTQPTEPGDGTVTSVNIAVPTFMNITNNPIITSGTMTIGLSGTPLPTANGGTGTTSVTGSGSLVLHDDPTINELNLTGVTGFNGNMFMNDNHVFLRNNVDHGMKWESDVNGPNIFGTDGGRLSSGGSGRVWWGPDGLSTNDTDYFRYTTGSWTPDFTWLKGTLGVSTANYTPTFTSSGRSASGSWIKIGKKVTLTWSLNFVVDNVGSDDILTSVLFPCITGSGNVLPFRITSGFRGASSFEAAGFPNGWSGAGVPAFPVVPVYPTPYLLNQIGNGGTQQFFQFFNSYGNWTSDGHRMPLFGTQNAYVVTTGPPFYALATSTGAPLSNQWFLGSDFSMFFNGSCTYFTD